VKVDRTLHSFNRVTLDRVGPYRVRVCQTPQMSLYKAHYDYDYN